MRISETFLRRSPARKKLSFWYGLTNCMFHGAILWAIIFGAYMALRHFKF